MAIQRALGAIALTTGVLSGCAGGSAPSGDVSKGAAPAGGAVKLDDGDNVFSPDSIRLKTGEKITMEVTNKGKRPHDFAIDDLGLNTGVLQPGEIAKATFTVPGSDVTYVCTLHRGMEGKVEVAKD
jgi:plastocyanin